MRTVTSLNTGLGDDVVTVDLEAGEDGFFVLDTQGGHQHVLPIAGGIGAGDHHTPADAIQVWIGGVPAAFSANPATGASACSSSGWIGAPVTVAVTRTTTQAFVLAGERPGDVRRDDAARRRRGHGDDEQRRRSRSRAPATR